MSEVGTAVILGFVEGLTEFIPVSSTGHLILVGEWLGFSNSNKGTFEIFIQLGAILAVLVLYRQRFMGLIPRKLDFSESGFSGISGILKIAIGVLPVLVAGFLLYPLIKSLMTPMSVAIALIVGGIAMLVLDRPKRTITCATLDQLTNRDCMVIGLFQCLSLWSGMSRAGSTMIGGLVMGCDRRVAAEYSFLIAVPVMFAAVAYELYKSIASISMGDIPLFLTGFLVAFVSALLAIRIFIKLIGSVSLRPFGWYRIVLGIAVLAALS